jgi:hypothetical protein
MGLYLDNKEVECGHDVSLARCDRCGEGLTALERGYARAARERQTVEETLDEVADDCVFCFVEATDDTSVSWTHRPEECERADWRTWRDLDERFRRLIKFEESLSVAGRSSGDAQRDTVDKAGCYDSQDRRFRRRDGRRERVRKVARLETQTASLG